MRHSIRVLIIQMICLRRNWKDMLIKRVPRKKDIAKRMIITWAVMFTAGLIIGAVIGGLIW